MGSFWGLIESSNMGVVSYDVLGLFGGGPFFCLFKFFVLNGVDGLVRVQRGFVFEEGLFFGCV